MKYIAQSSPSTMLGAGIRGARAAVVAIARDPKRSASVTARLLAPPDMEHHPGPQCLEIGRPHALEVHSLDAADRQHLPLMSAKSMASGAIGTVVPFLALSRLVFQEMTGD